MDTLSSEIYQLVKKRAVEQAAFSRSSYLNIVEETIDYFRQKGKLTDEDNEEFIKEELAGMLEALKDEVAEK